MVNRNHMLWTLVLWSILGFFIFLSYNLIKGLITDLVLTVGFALKIEPDFLQYHTLVSNVLVIVFLIIIYIKSRTIEIQDSRIDFPISLAKKIGLIALGLFVLDYIILFINNTVFFRDYVNTFGETSKMLYKKSNYLNFGMNLLELIIIIIVFFNLIKHLKKSNIIKH